MLFDIAKEEWFIPKWNGNMDLSEEDQVQVLICPPSGVSGVRSAQYALKEKLDDESTILAFDFMSYCKEVKNLQTKVDGKLKDITPMDIATLPGLHELFFEIRQYYSDNYSMNKKK